MELRYEPEKLFHNIMICGLKMKNGLIKQKKERD